LEDARGFIARFECEVEGNNITDLTIDFNYEGSGDFILGWMVTFIGDFEEGNIGSNGTYALQASSDHLGLTDGQTIQFRIVVENATYYDDNFNVRCITDSAAEPVAEEPVVADGARAKFDSVNAWEFDNGVKGFIALYECTLTEDTLKQVFVDFNYTGSGTQLVSWFTQWTGEYERGYIADDGGYAMRNVRHVPHFNVGDKIQFKLLVDDAVYNESDMDVMCM